MNIDIEFVVIVTLYSQISALREDELFFFSEQGGETCLGCEDDGLVVYQVEAAVECPVVG